LSHLDIHFFPLSVDVVANSQSCATTGHSQKQATTAKTTQYCFLGSPYGVKVVSSVFQRYVQTLFEDMPFVSVHIDNLVACSRTWAKHKQHVRAVIELHKAVQALKFLGIVNLLCQHIHHLSVIEEPLNRARASQEAYDREYKENADGMKESFNVIKQAIAKLPILRYPYPDRSFHVAPDASRTGIGAVLYQLTPQQEELGDTSIQADNIVMITSRALSSYERNYAVFKLELLAVVNALKEFRDFLYGRHFHLHTDHRPLVYVLGGGSKPNHPTINGWINEIQDFDFSVSHTPGFLNLLPDHLSRLYSRTDVWGVANTAVSQATKERALGDNGAVVSQASDARNMVWSNTAIIHCGHRRWHYQATGYKLT